MLSKVKRLSTFVFGIAVIRVGSYFSGLTYPQTTIYEIISVNNMLKELSSFYYYCSKSGQLQFMQLSYIVVIVYVL